MAKHKDRYEIYYIKINIFKKLEVYLILLLLIVAFLQNAQNDCSIYFYLPQKYENKKY